MIIAGVSSGPSYWIAAGIVVVFLGLVYFVAGTGPTRTRSFWGLLVGKDGRTSTSKVQFALWTLALSYALLVIVIHVGTYGNQSLDPRYLLLLGFPAGAAIGAKVVTTSQLNAGSITKPPGPRSASVATRVADVVSDDQGNVDLGDAQYFMFNLVALTAFAVAFAHDPTRLPILPDTLVGLTSASAAAYLVKKAATTQPMAVTGVAPSVATPGSTLHVVGTNLDGGTGLPPTVFIDGHVAAVTLGSPSGVVVTVPAIAVGAPPGSRPVVVDVLSSDRTRTASTVGKLTV